MPRIDMNVKALPIECVRDVVGLVLPELTDFAPSESEVADAPQLRMDRVFTAYDTEVQRRVFVHVELQGYSDKAIPRRIYQYAARLNMSVEEDTPVYSIVIWFVPHGVRIPKPVYTSPVGDGTNNHWRYQQIVLYDVSKAKLKDTNAIGLLALSPFFGDITAEDIEPNARRLGELAPPQNRESLLLIYASLAAKIFTDLNIMTLLRKVGVGMDFIQEAIVNGPIVAWALEQRRPEIEAEIQARIVPEVEARVTQEVEARVTQEVEARVTQEVEGNEHARTGEVMWRMRFQTELPDVVREGLQHCPHTTFETFVGMMMQSDITPEQIFTIFA